MGVGNYRYKFSTILKGIKGSFSKITLSGPNKSIVWRTALPPPPQTGLILYDYFGQRIRSSYSIIYKGVFVPNLNEICPKW